MVYMWEFELFEEGEFVNAFPVEGLDGGTCAYSVEEAVEYAYDWLTMVVDDALMSGKELPKPYFDAKPQHDGMMVVITVSRDLDQIPAMTAAEAARELGISSARVSQLVKSGALESWMSGTRRMISKASVESRKAEMPKPGRPKNLRSA